MKKHSKVKYNFKNDLEILIRLFYYHKFLKEKDNLEFKTLKQENYKIVYLINNDWIEKYKSFYDYDELENYLLQSKNESFIIDKDFITEQSIQKITSTLPQSYIKKLENKSKFDEKFNRYDTDKIISKKVGIKNEFSYLVNNQIINKKIHDTLIEAEYETSEISLKSCKLYFIGNKRILLLFNSDVVNDNHEIGYINDKNIFIPQFVLYNEEDNYVILPHLNNFLKNYFPSFISNQEKESCRVCGENNSIIGTCFRVNKNKNKSENSKVSNNITIKELKKSPLGGFENDIQKYIELFIEFYLFYEEMNKKIKQNLFISKIEKYYIIKKKWTNKIMEYFEYNKFKEYIIW